MEYEQLINLIKTVSASSLSAFEMEDGDLKICMEKNVQGQVIVQNPQTVLEAKPEEEKKEETIEGNVVKAPLVGTFYASSSPEGEPFVKVGDVVRKGQTLGIIEAMKLMNEIESEFDGTVEAILIENGNMVEYGQSLFVIRP
ncbi:MAG: acetyl-CoA carboxylase biotin carboxyl carrier protein [Lachnospiraceae bacterium]|nr:acetyl-CoA carboxylase biotin carboxyl carrier protein [Robinsoniella sp.]MDY3765797.1 acetyl-CoA carboxylase biotin carboxyl carrier protein [Lachnospiraceae bacterium]